MTDSASWQRLCTLIDDDPELWPSVQQALVSADGHGPWAALIDALDDCGALAYLQLDDTAMELADALAGVPRVVRLELDTDGIGDIDGDVHAAAPTADALLAPVGLALLYLEEDPDALPLVVVPVHAVAEIVSTATSLGFQARQLA